MARYFHLDEADKEFIGKSRGDHNRLGIALQIGRVRFLGTFLTDMNHIPSGVRHFIARQLGIHDITVQAGYRQVAARLGENEAVELDVSGPKPRLTISPLASVDEPDSLKRLSKQISELCYLSTRTELAADIVTTYKSAFHLMLLTHLRKIKQPAHLRQP